MAPCGHHHLFYAPPGSVREGCIHFSREESMHIVSSLRMAAGDDIAASDGAGRLFEAVLVHARRGGAVARVKRVVEVPPPDVTLTLFQGMIRPRKMDLVIEKCVELGVDSIVPIVTERALARDTRSRLVRWKRIALGAMKQSLRAHLAEVRPAAAFADVLEEASGLERILVAHEAESADGLRAGDMPAGAGAVGLFVGPEGGFSGAEIEALAARGARVFGLGEGRLRSETAAIAAVAIVRHLLGRPAVAP